MSYYPEPTAALSAPGGNPKIFCLFIEGHINLSIVPGGGTRAQVCVNTPYGLRPIYEALKDLFEPASECVALCCVERAS